jgi:hypothetical protein
VVRELGWRRINTNRKVSDRPKEVKDQRFYLKAKSFNFVLSNITVQKYN